MLAHQPLTSRQLHIKSWSAPLCLFLCAFFCAQAPPRRTTNKHTGTCTPKHLKQHTRSNNNTHTAITHMHKHAPAVASLGSFSSGACPMYRGMQSPARNSCSFIVLPVLVTHARLSPYTGNVMGLSSLRLITCVGDCGAFLFLCTLHLQSIALDHLRW